ncbi:MAG: CoA transferase [Deltaproteobacteria bacterium]|nr:CoA transferase [Deltaproteobacteria bacterium]
MELAIGAIFPGMRISMKSESQASGPLAGVRVLDISTVVSGPLCGQALGDLGADVVKIEAFGGDTTRRMGLPDACGFTGWYLQFNRNKRGLAVNLKTESGVNVLKRLARTADVLVENFRPGVADRLGVGFDVLATENPRLIYAAISGFGPDGPYRDLPAYDSVIQGVAGFMRTQGGGDEPTLVRSIAADKASAMTALYAVLAALYAREKNGGRGQRIDIPMLDSWIAFILPDIFQDRTYKAAPEPGPGPSLHRTWATKDGSVVMMIIEDHQFHAMCRVLEREDLIDDPRCANLITRFMNADTLFAELETEIVKRTTQELVERARKLGAPVAPANGIPEMMQDPQALHAQIVMEVDHEEAGTLRYLRNPVRFAETPTSLRAHPPKLGEHTEELLRAAGFSAEEIGALREEGAVA